MTKATESGPERARPMREDMEIDAQHSRPRQNHFTLKGSN